MTILTVSSLNEQIKNLLESHFHEVAVEGEVSRPTYHTSGHLYFSLKDEDSLLKCVMFRSDVATLPFRLEDGQKVIVFGRIGIYKPRGEYQLYAKAIEPAGVGALKVAFEQLKQKLAAEGLFDERFKQPLPKFVKRMALVTSSTGAALQDMLRIIKQRWPLIKVIVVDTLVQGREAAPMIADALRYADRLGVDVIVLSRGGGSLEDLWAFNEEVVARAIFEAKTPIVSAIGHEIDYLISDFVADLRAPTPSAAMEMILPDRQEVLLAIDSMMERFLQRMEQLIFDKSQTLQHLVKTLQQLSPANRLQLLKQQIDTLKSRFDQAILVHINAKSTQIPHLQQTFRHLMNQKVSDVSQQLLHLQEQFELAMHAKQLPPKSAQVIKNGKPVELAALEVGDEIELQDMKRKIRAKVLGKDAL